MSRRLNLCLVVTAACAALAWSRATCLGAQTPGAADTARRTLTALRVHERIVVDGALDEPGWSSAEVARGFRQQEPTYGAPASLPTEVRVLYDERAVYVGARLSDAAPDSIVARLARRDEPSGSDEFTVLLDSRHDGRTAFSFTASPLGAKRDSYLSDLGQQEDVGWDPVWDVAARTDSLGWTVEMRIPLSQLRFRPGAGGELPWGIQFSRRVARRNEVSEWSPVPKLALGPVPYLGQLRGVVVTGAPRQRELEPYVLSGVTSAPSDPGNPFWRPTRWRRAAGADLRLGVTEGLTLSAAINPDFGQLEADPSVVNLTAFETFYEERRPLFVEGSDVFAVPIGDFFDQDRLFYSRRIGRAPDAPTAPSAVFVAPTDAATILSAAKLTGRAGRDWVVGALGAVTAPVTTAFSDAQGSITRLRAAPLTGYTALRLSREYDDGAGAIGGILTSALRTLGDAPVDSLPRRSIAAGLDTRYRWRTVQMVGSVIGSAVSGAPAAITELQRSPVHFFQRPDAPAHAFDSARSALGGVAAYARVEKPEGSWRWGLSARGVSPGFDVNELGFQTSADLLRGWAYGGYQDERPRRLTRWWFAYLNRWTAASTRGEHLRDSSWIAAGAQLLDYTTVSADAWRLSPALSLSELRGGPAMSVAGRTGASLAIETDERRPIRLQLRAAVARGDQGDGRSVSLEPGIVARWLSQAELSLSAVLARADGQLQYVGAVDGAADGAASAPPHYVYGRLRERTGSLVTRLSYAFSPRLTLQWYAQPFASGVAFASFAEVVAPRATTVAARFHAFGANEIRLDRESHQYQVSLGTSGSSYTFADPNFNARSLHSTAVLRWEYRPGSTLLVVWSAEGERPGSEGAFDLGRDFRTVLAAPRSNSVAVKLSYWIGR